MNGREGRGWDSDDRGKPEQQAKSKGGAAPQSVNEPHLMSSGHMRLDGLE